MEKPNRPADESERLAALQQLDILDTPPEERFDRYTRLAKRLFDVPIALVSLVDEDRQWFKSRQGLNATETPRDISFCGHAILNDQVFVVGDASQDQRFRDNPLVTGDPHIRFYAGFPLAGPSGHRIGTLCIIDREPRELDAQDREALRDIGAMVAGELSSLSLATTDQLTGLANRRGFEKLAGQAIAMCQRNGQPVALAMIDLDGFKAINDQHGHAAGDRALADFANLMLVTFRESDVIARLGGDEFCVLLTGTSEALAHQVVERLQRAVHEHNQGSGRSAGVLAFSAGISAHLPGRLGSVADLLHEADARMYSCKRDSQRRYSAAGAGQ